MRVECNSAPACPHVAHRETHGHGRKGAAEIVGKRIAQSIPHMPEFHPVRPDRILPRLLAEEIRPASIQPHGEDHWPGIAPFPVVGAQVEAVCHWSIEAQPRRKRPAVVELRARVDSSHFDLAVATAEGHRKCRVSLVRTHGCRAHRGRGRMIYHASVRGVRVSRLTEHGGSHPENEKCEVQQQRS